MLKAPGRETTTPQHVVFAEFLSHPLVMITTMRRQLVLMEPDKSDWRLDEATKEIGRRGIAEARKALQRAAQSAAA